MSCSLLCRQFFLLLWKNFILQIRRPVGTAFELILPIFAVLFIVVLRRTSLFPTDNRIFTTFGSDSLTVPTTPALVGNFTNPLNYTIYYTPEDTNTTFVVDRAIEKLGVDVDRLGFDNETVMVEALGLLREPISRGCFRKGAGIVFNLTDSNMEYTIRLRHEVGERNTWFTGFAAPVFQLPGSRIEPNSYLEEGFLHLQDAVSQSLIEWKTGTVLDMDVAVRQFPYPSYNIDLFLSLVSASLSILLIMAYIYSAGIIVKELVLEKESRIRESMLMMGLRQWVLWTTWYIKEFIFLLITVFVISLLLKFGGVFPNSDWLLLFIYFTLFIISMISFCFFVSVWFDSARIGLIVGFVAWFVNYFPFLFLPGRFDSLNLGSKVAACLLSNTCMGLGAEVISRLEQRQEGLRWSNVASPLSLDDDFNMAWVFGMLLIDSFIYMLIAWYVNNVKPGQYGVPKPFYFPFLPSYWLGKPLGTREMEQEAVALHEETDRDPAAHEDPPDLEAGIVIRSLSKIYGQSVFTKLFEMVTKCFNRNGNGEDGNGSRKKAVDRLNLKMYKGQITALLGHNGAGKTTTMSILTGLYTPTSGSATINGYSILTDMDQIRKSLGICPQHNVLFDRLTVEEHLSFFMRLKGATGGGRSVREEVDMMIADLQLMDKKKIQSQRLSGGMKRKLSVGIALVGGSEIVILDEPTSGMDPYARRATWDLLIKHKQNRTLLLTTHFMDEADLLGDRIAILAEGKLRCSGSSLFLKSRYGVGYHMTIVKNAACDSSRVEQLIHSFVPLAEQVTDVGAELSFILPSSATAKFPDLFDQLESQKVGLGVSSFGVSITTMEEVFMKVGEGTDEALDDRLRHAGTLSPTSPARTFPGSPHRTATKSPEPVSPPPAHSQVVEVDIQDLEMRDGEDGTREVQVVSLDMSRDGTVTPDPPRPSILEVANSKRGESEDTIRLTDSLTYQYTPNTGLVLWFQQFCAMFLKRLFNTMRFYGAIFSQLLLPLLFVLFAMVLTISTPNADNNDPPRSLNLENSALSAENLTLFYAQFGDIEGSSVNFSTIEEMRASLGATDILDVTGEVEQIKSDLTIPNVASDCCSYEFQILDQMCATQERLASQCQNTEFGYNNCDDCGHCLQCCTASGRNFAVGTCTNPLVPEDNNRADLCPQPPQLSFSAAMADNPSGLLENNNTFIAEHLLRVAKDLRPENFFRRYQAGFTLSYRDSPYTVCGCRGESNGQPNVCQFISPLQTSNTSVENPRYAINQLCALAWGVCIESLGMQIMGQNGCDMLEQLQQFRPDCANFTTPLNFSLRGDPLTCSNESVPTGYRVDGASANILQFASCQVPGIPSSVDYPRCANANKTLHAIYPDQDQTIAATVWYNNQPFHMPPVALNLFHNVWLRQLSNDDSLTITVRNHPLPRTLATQIDDAGTNPNGLGVGTLIVFGYSFLLASFVLFLVKEKESKAKHIQFVSGVHSTSYWLASLAWDLLNAAVPVIISFLLIAAFNIPEFRGTTLAAVLLLLMFTCWAGIPFTYIISFLFSNSLAAFGILVIFFFFSALFATTVVFVVQGVNGADTANIIHYVCLLFPSYGLSIAFNDIFINHGFVELCERNDVTRQLCVDQNIQYTTNIFSFDRPGIGVILLYLFIEGAVFMGLTLLIQRKFFFPEIRSLCGGTAKDTNRHGFEVATAEPLLHGEDSDVYAERKKVLSGNTNENDSVIIKNLTKVYSAHLSGCSLKPAKRAVAGINLAIPNGECFGLLGVNGAGKTSTFSIITGETAMTSGTALVAGFDIRTHLKNVQQRIGYCPQFDALIERLTGRELLTVFARLRGVPEAQIKEVVETEIRRLDLKKYADKRCGTYSGGNKRKLCTAIALVGNPPIVLLDEPTTGMDPTTRRNLWDVLTGITREGRSIILTSHSMEECEALCTRIAIMVNGTFKCLGSIQHLKNKYGAGFTLQAKVKLVPPPVLERAPSKRMSFRRQGSTREHSVPTHDLESSGVQVVANPNSNPSSSPTPTPVPPIALSGGPSSSAHGVFNPYDTTSLHIFVREAFPGAVLREEHQGAVTYQLPSTGISWSSVFRQLESNKERLGIIDYSVSQTTLDQVFIDFAKEQVEDDRV